MSRQQNNLELAGELIYEALGPHFTERPDEERQNATADVIARIEHLVSTQPVNKGRKGATVMTEGASMHKMPGSAPRSL